MPPKSARLDRLALMRVLRRGRRLHTPSLSLVYGTVEAPPSPRGSQGDSQRTSRVAAVVGKKVAKQATDRNRIRRRLYAALSELSLPEGYLVVIAKPQLRDASYRELTVELQDALARLLGDVRRSG